MQGGHPVTLIGKVSVGTPVKVKSESPPGTPISTVPRTNGMPDPATIEGAVVTHVVSMTSATIQGTYPWHRRPPLHR